MFQGNFRPNVLSVTSGFRLSPATLVTRSSLILKVQHVSKVHSKIRLLFS